MFFCPVASADSTNPVQKESAPSQQAAPQNNKAENQPKAPAKNKEQKVVEESVKKALQDPKSGYQFTDQTVIDIAKKLAKSPMVPPLKAPKELTDMNYSTYRKINFQQNQAVWGNTPTPFSIQLFAPGYIYKDLVDIDVVENGRAFPLEVSPSSFSTPNKKLAKLIDKVGKYAGLRLHYPINTKDHSDEFIVFQGATYFRAISKGQTYGLSARGLAIDVAQPTGEEFPMFKHFWIERPSVTQKAIVVHALLDSKSVTGAYRFGIYPGSPTRIDVKATLFPRQDVPHVGLAPLTSMFMFGTMDPSDEPDYRRRVHDSEGLQIQTGHGEILWRPLNNPKTLQISSFYDKSPKGFGLIQRHRNYSDYQDLEANYQTRPSAWVKPLNDWGAGHVELVEIPSNSEGNDNIVTYWQPKGGLKKDKPYSFSYQLTWPNDTPVLANKPHIVRSAKGTKLFGKYKGKPEVVIDYSDINVDDIKKIHINASTSAGKILETHLVKNPHINGIRVYVTFDTDNADVAELRVALSENHKEIASTWLYRWLKQQ
ncbi:Glucans biosynthesis protein G precursor [Marinomonas spartinae]|uniref:Glucans biosynthesis protein G n=1 Tax=Marinomonas spartinae TaxID=1792290 RepID=A0A1A8TSZ7_9GAMM|nr:glucan biosynthesis protein G [Marinomonas spartinae]SBS36812.1 Glucans biosynthesis protein G precursor [Marinomonas spartinae]